VVLEINNRLECCKAKEENGFKSIEGHLDQFRFRKLRERKKKNVKLLNSARMERFSTIANSALIIGLEELKKNTSDPRLAWSYNG
jgi:hypothetical protein